MIRFLFLFLSFLPFSASAGLIGKAGPSTVSKGSNVWEVVYDSGNTVSNTRTWASGADAGSLILSDVVEATISNSKKANLLVRNPITAAAAGRVVSKLVPLVGTASLAYDLWELLDCSYVNGQVSCKDYSDQIDIEVGEYCVTNNTCAPTADASCKKNWPLSVGRYLYGQTYACADANNPDNWFATVSRVTNISKGCSSGSSPKADFCVGDTAKPSSPDEVEDRAGKRGPKIPGFVEKLPGVLKEGQDNGLPVEAGSPQVSGPPSVQGSPSVNTSNKPDGSVVTTTSTPTYNITYQGNTYTITTVNNSTTVTTNPDGSTTTESTSEQPSPESVAPPADPDMPQVPALYEKKYPDGISGVWNSRKSELQTTPIFSFLASLVPSTGDGGCPSWQLPVMYGIGNTATVDISIPCWIWSAIRAIFIVTALLSCRRIIFGG